MKNKQNIHKVHEIKKNKEVKNYSNSPFPLPGINNCSLCSTCRVSGFYFPPFHVKLKIFALCHEHHDCQFSFHVYIFDLIHEY